MKVGRFFALSFSLLNAFEASFNAFTAPEESPSMLTLTPTAAIFPSIAKVRKQTLDVFLSVGYKKIPLSFSYESGRGQTGSISGEGVRELPGFFILFQSLQFYNISGIGSPGQIGIMLHPPYGGTREAGSTSGAGSEMPRTYQHTH
jgi:hypothetical protein